MILVASYRYQEPVWLLGRDVLLVSVLFAVAAFASLVVSKAWTKPDYGFLLSAALGATYTVIASAIIVGLYYAFDFHASRILLVIDATILTAVVVVNYSGLRIAAVVLVNLVIFVASLAPNLSAASISSFKENVLNVQSVEFDENVDYVFSSRHDLKLTRFDVETDLNPVVGGGISLLGDDRLLLGTGDGRFFVVSFAQSQTEATITTISAPLNRDEYLARSTKPSPSFRVTDMFVTESDADVRSLFVSHHYWNSDDACLTLRLSEIQLDVVSMTPLSNIWQTRFESAPCLPVDDWYLSNENGGRIGFLASGVLLLTVGSHEYDSQFTDLTEYESSSYGKIIAIDTDTWRSTVFSSGHRNPQGLLVTENTIWATEHGPHGGDELNIVYRGGDYGWPYSTYGTEYGQKQWPRVTGYDEHERGQKPVYAWVPSIGVSNLIEISGKAFSAWRGDLLVSSLIGLGNGKSLFRVKIEQQRAVVVERIHVGHPVRDLLEIDDGRLVLWDGSNALTFVEASNHIFSECSGCHALRWQSHGVGPDLMGVVGERVARHKEFRYSQALRDFGGRWTTERLDEFLRDPASAVPGTTMQYGGIEDSKRRAQIIQYLTDLPND